VAIDAGGVEAVREWIEAAGSTHPALVDVRHEVGLLYGMVNVPNAVWIDEHGTVVRPAETAGSIDAFRRLDRSTLARTEEAAASIARARATYLEALRGWVRTGRHALSPEDVRRRSRRTDPVAATHFRLGVALHAAGDGLAGDRHLTRAGELEPGNWNLWRQARALTDATPGEQTQLSAMGPSAARFWEAVDALGDDPFYPPAQFD
jgi:hypothetical protein